MKIVIELSDSVFKRVKDDYVNPYEIDEMCAAILDGTPLPKGHGRIIDESKINKCGWNFVNHHAKTDAPTIIEEDKEGEDEADN